MVVSLAVVVVVAANDSKINGVSLASFEPMSGFQKPHFTGKKSTQRLHLFTRAKYLWLAGQRRNGY